METKIQLIDEVEQQPKKDIKRPTKLDLAGITTNRQKWEQCKVYGKNILIRSYAGACAVQSELYVYGGLQILNGILSDFSKINIKSSQTALKWENVPVSNDSDAPGPRAKHGLVAYENRIFLVGGIKSVTETSKQIFVYNTQAFVWQKLSPKGCEFPPLETFGCVLVKKQHPKIVVLCGYNGELCQSTNSVYSYDILSNTLDIIFKHSSERGSHPTPRVGCTAAFDQDSTIYLFGGKSESQQERFNDFWEFDLNSNKFKEIKQDQLLKPTQRNGHTMTFYEGKLFLFGGIHDITWELDDLHIYDIKAKRWMLLESNSARKKKDLSPNKAINQKKQKEVTENESPQKKRMEQTGISPHLYAKKGQTKVQSPETGSPTKTTINELKHKAFLQKKAEMLRNFQVKEEEKPKLLSMQASSQAMKNSLDLIGNGLIPPDSPLKNKKTQMSKTTHSRFMQPLDMTPHFVPGRKPCARDGHNAVLIDKQLIIFGGDRHHMSFNDLHVLHLDAVTQDLSKL